MTDNNYDAHIGYTCPEPPMPVLDEFPKVGAGTHDFSKSAIPSGDKQEAPAPDKDEKAQPPAQPEQAPPAPVSGEKEFLEHAVAQITNKTSEFGDLNGPCCMNNF